MREALFFCFNLKKSVAESHSSIRLLLKTYGEHAVSEITCRDWFRRFENNDFDVNDNECPSRKSLKMEDWSINIIIKVINHKITSRRFMSDAQKDVGNKARIQNALTMM